MSAIKELLLRIKSSYDGSGTTAATKAVGGDLTAANDKASTAAKKTGKDVSEAAKRGSDSLNMMSVATAAMSGNFNAAASAAVPLLEKSKSLNMSMTQLSIAGAALTAVVAGLRAISEWVAAAAQRVANIQMDNFTNKVRAASEAYDKLVESMRNTAAVKDATLAFNNSMVDSYTRQALAINELNKQRELASTSDEATRREIESKYTDKASAIKGMSAVQKEASEKARSLERELEIETAINESKERQNELIKEAQESLTRGQNANATVKNNLGLLGSLFGSQQGTSTAYAKIAGQYGAVTDDKLKAAQDEERRREQLENERLEVLRARERASVDSRSGSIERSAVDVASQTASADRSRANDKAVYEKLQQIDTELADFSQSDQQFVFNSLKATKEARGLIQEDLNELLTVLRSVKDSMSRERNR